MGLTYDEARELARAKWDTANPDTPACYVQEVKFSDRDEWRICDVTSAIVGYVKLNDTQRYGRRLTCRGAYETK